MVLIMAISNLANASPIRRVAFDIGSLTTKMIVADIDTKQGTIEKVLLKDVRQAGYKHDLERPNSDGTVSSDMLQRGIAALSQLKNEADALTPSPTEYAAVGTAAMRAAKNGSEVAKAIHEALKIPLFIIPQEKEAVLGFKGALANTGFNKKNAVVWDAGGGSMQIIALTHKEKLKTYGNEIGFIAFSKQVIDKIQHKQLDAQATPNPLNEQQAQEAIALAETLAKEVPHYFKKKIAAKKSQVAGIGALYYATHGTPQDKKVFTQNDLEEMLKTKLNKTDAELASVTHRAIPAMVGATSLCLMIGFMKALGISQITLMEVNMTDGLLVESEYYK